MTRVIYTTRGSVPSFKRWNTVLKPMQTALIGQAGGMFRKFPWVLQLILQSEGRDLQDSWDIIYLPLWSLYRIPFQTSYRVQTGFVSTTVLFNIECALCTRKLSLVITSVWTIWDTEVSTLNPFYRYCSMILKHAQFAQTAANNVWSTRYACSKLYLSLKYGILQWQKNANIWPSLFKQIF